MASRSHHGVSRVLPLHVGSCASCAYRQSDPLVTTIQAVGPVITCILRSLAFVSRFISSKPLFLGLSRQSFALASCAYRQGNPLVTTIQAVEPVIICILRSLLRYPILSYILPCSTLLPYSIFHFPTVPLFHCATVSQSQSTVTSLARTYHC